MELYDLIERDKDALVRDLQSCIRIPSVETRDDSGYPYGEQVHRCLHYMLDTAAKLGFSVHNMDEQLGWCEYGQGEEMAAVLCHLDVVPEGEGWTVPPYEGRVADGRIYGRGAMDDKGPALCALYALKAVRDAGVPLKRRVRILFGLNEETGSADMKYYTTHGGEIPVMGITPTESIRSSTARKGWSRSSSPESFTRPGKSAWRICAAGRLTTSSPPRPAPCCPVPPGRRNGSPQSTWRKSPAP